MTDTAKINATATNAAVTVNGGDMTMDNDSVINAGHDATVNVTAGDLNMGIPALSTASIKAGHDATVNVSAGNMTMDNASLIQAVNNADVDVSKALTMGTTLGSTATITAGQKADVTTGTDLNMHNKSLINADAADATVTVGGALTMTDTAKINATAGNAIVTAGGAMDMEGTSLINAGIDTTVDVQGGDLSMSTTSGSATIQATGKTNVTVENGDMYMDNASKIKAGTDATVDVQNGSLTMSNLAAIEGATKADVNVSGDMLMNDSASVVSTDTESGLTKVTVGGDLTMNDDGLNTLTTIKSAKDVDINVSGNMTMNNGSKVDAVNLADVTVTKTLDMNNSSAIDPLDVILSVGALNMSGTSSVTASHNIDVTAGTAVDMSDSAKIDAGHNTTVTVSTGNMTMDNNSLFNAGNDATVNVTTGSLTMSATNGGATISGGNNVDITTGTDVDMYNSSAVTATGTADITAGGHIFGPTGMVTADTLNATAGGLIDLSTTVKTLNATTSAAGDITINETDGIDLNNVKTANGAISVTAGDQIKATSVDSSSGVGDITLTSNGAGIEADSINAGSSNNVILDAKGGAITKDSATNPNVIANDLNAKAAGGIDLNTQINTLTASTSAVGDVKINEKDAIDLTSVTTNNGKITVTANGQIKAINVDSSNTNSGSNDITLRSTSAGIEADLINAGSNNNVVLDAQGAAITQDGDAAADVIAKNLKATAAGSIGLDTTIASLDASTTAAGNVVINETDAIDLADVVTSNGAVIVNAGGQIKAVNVDTSNTDNGTNDITLTGGIAGTGGIEVDHVHAGVANDVKLDASNGAITQDGDAAPDVISNHLEAIAKQGIDMDTQSSNIAALNKTSGAIQIDNTGDVNITDVGTTVGLKNQADGGALGFTAASDINIKSDVTSAGGDIAISASDSVTQDAGTTVASSGGDIAITSDNNNDGTGGITQTGTARMLSSNGDITLKAGTTSTGGGDILLGLLDAGNGGVSVTTNNGSILDNNDVDTTNSQMNVIAGNYSYLRAPSTATGKGIVGTEDNPIEVNVQITPTNELTPPLVDGAPATSGLILEMGGVDALTGMSGNIKGIVRPGSGYNGVTGSPQIAFAKVTPPGTVYYQDTDMGGAITMIPTAVPATAANYVVPQEIWPWPSNGVPADALTIMGDGLKFRLPSKSTADNFQISQTQGPNTFVAPQVYFYHPLVEMNSVEAPALGLDAYEFIDNNINATNPALLPGGPTEENKKK